MGSCTLCPADGIPHRACAPVDPRAPRVPAAAETRRGLRELALSRQAEASAKASTGVGPSVLDLGVDPRSSLIAESLRCEDGVSEV